MGLRLTPHHLATSETDQSAFSIEQETQLSTPQSSSIVDNFETNLDSTPPPQPAKYSTPLRNRRGDITFIFDNNDSIAEEEEDVDSSLVVRFPPEASQIEELDNDDDGEEEEEEKEEEGLIERLPCDLGETDFALHSSVYLVLTDPPGPPSYSQVEKELEEDAMSKGQEEVSSSQSVAESQPQLIDKREIDLSASLSVLWSQEQQKRQETTLLGSPAVLASTSFSASGNPISRRAFLPVQVRFLSPTNK